MSHQTVVFYEDTGSQRGRILCVTSADDASIAAAAQRRGKPYLEVPAAPSHDPAAWLSGKYVDLSGATPAVVDCRPQTGVWDASSASLAGLPVPCTVRLLDVALDVDDGSADLTDHPAGPYAVLVTAVGWINRLYEVTR